MWWLIVVLLVILLGSLITFANVDDDQVKSSCVVGIIISAIGLVVLLIGSTIFFVVDNTQQAVIVKMGNPVRTIKDAGFYARTPLVESVRYFDKRNILLVTDPQTALTVDKKTLSVDYYSQWEILDPLQFMKTLTNERLASARVDDVVYSTLREVLGTYTLYDLLSPKREDIMKTVTEKSRDKLKNYGINIVSVRLKRTDLPEENMKAIYERMNAERSRKANQYRSEGEGSSTNIKADVDRKVKVILANAYKKSQEIKGDGDASAIRIYAQAYNQDPEFFVFTNTLKSYETTIGSGTVLVMSAGDGYFDKMNSSNVATSKKR